MKKKRCRIRCSMVPNRGVWTRKLDFSSRHKSRSNPRLCRGIRHSARVNERAVKTAQREWMGIEPTRPLFRGLTGFEARGSHQIYKHSRIRGDVLEIFEGRVASRQQLSRLVRCYQLSGRFSHKTVAAYLPPAKYVVASGEQTRRQLTRCNFGSESALRRGTKSSDCIAACVLFQCKTATQAIHQLM